MNIGIVGLGLIGGTIARSLKRNHFVSAYDINEDTLTYALENKIIEKAYRDLGQFFQENDVIFLCLYPETLLNFIFQNKHLMPINSVLIEVSGIKKHIIEKIRAMNLENIDIIYTHPIAGSEKVGVAHSKESIFKNANYVITPVMENKKSNVELAKKLANEMGFLNISMITPEEHDSIISYTSQLTHVLSLSLVNSLSTELDTKKFIGDSYRDLTRISMINEKLWPQLFVSNKDELLKVINLFEKELNEFKDSIASQDTEKLSKLMVKSTQIRTKIERGDDDEN